MPTSTYIHLPAYVTMLIQVNPASILDIGLGNGKMGFIARDCLDVMLGERYKKEEWKLRLDGIEVFGDYIQQHQRALYDEIFIGNAFDVINELSKYEVIVIGDVLEHFEEAKAWEFLDKCAEHCTRYMILNIPLGEKWIQPEIYGNPHEEHLSFWKFEQFEPFVELYELFKFPEHGDYGCMLIKRDNYAVYRALIKAEEIARDGDSDKAEEYLAKALEMVSPDINHEYVFVDFLLRAGRMDSAIERLRNVRNIYPENDQAKKYLDDLLRIKGAQAI